MANISIIYWSGTGNTEAMADLIKEGIVSENGDVKISSVDSASINDVVNSKVLVLGCPSMGNEVLEESEMEPFIKDIGDKVNGKIVALFGSYGWGDGQWMRDWEERMKEVGADLIEDGLIINGSPDAEEDRESCINLGKKLAKI